MNSPDTNHTNGTDQSVKKPIATMSWVILLIGLAAIVFAIYSAQNVTEEEPKQVLTV